MDSNGTDNESPSATITTAPGPPRRPGALIWSLRKSRDRWKSKHQALKVSLKRHKNRVADLTKSRQQWKLKAEQIAVRLAEADAQVATLRAEVDSNPGGEKSPRPSHDDR